MADVREWAPLNGASLAYVARKRGWPLFQAQGKTVAHETERSIVWHEDADDAELRTALRQLGLSW